MSTHHDATDSDATDSTDSTGSRQPEDPFAERLRLQGEAMVAKIKELLHEGNVQRITVRDRAGHIVLEIPVNAGVAAVVVAPVLVAVAALAALAVDWDIEVARSAPAV